MGERSLHRFTINKTGLEMFDVFRAYGLALAISGRYREYKTYIQDTGYAFKIDAPCESLPAEIDHGLLEGNNREWENVFGTFRDRKNTRHPKELLREILEEDYEKILEIHQKPDFVPKFGKSLKEGVTLYQSIDNSASKGFREEKRGQTYSEGTQLKVDKYSWAIACLGAAYFGKWFRSFQGKSSIKISLIPNPLKVLLISHRDLHFKLGDLDKKICKISGTTIIAHYALKLVRFLATKSFNVRYDSIVFNIVQQTRQQSKPSGGGKYTLHFLENLSKTPFGFKAIAKLDEFFDDNSYQGIKGIRRDVALATAEFLIRPTFENFRRWESLYIRGYINEKLPLWDKSLLEEIIKNVETP